MATARPHPRRIDERALARGGGLYARWSTARRRRRSRGVALLLVLGALAVMTVMLAQLQDDSSLEMSLAASERDALRAEYAARSGVNLSRLLIASEPTIRQALTPLFLMMKKGPPQLPVWEFNRELLGAFNDAEGARAFGALASLDLSEAKGLGLHEARFELRIIDEDSKLSVNMAARPDTFSAIRLGQQLQGLLGSVSHDPLFERTDDRGEQHDRLTICSAIVDWVDADQDTFDCSGSTTAGGAAPAEDEYYSFLRPPYPRKNAAFDSLEELRLVRGVDDVFWATFVEPDPDDPDKRVMTVWGQGKVNVNSANAQIIHALVCSHAVVDSPVCVDPLEATKFVSAIAMMRGFTAGIPVFTSEIGFVNALAGKGTFGMALEALQIEPIQLRSANELAQAISTQSKVFSIYSTGYARSGPLQTQVRIHAVVDFRKSPPPGINPLLLEALEESGEAATGATKPAATGSRATDDSLESAISGALTPNPGGKILYYRLD